MKGRFTRPYINSILVFLSGAAITSMAAFGIYSLGKQDEKELADTESEHIKTHFENFFEQSIATTKIISFLVENNLQESHFETVSAHLLNSNHFIGSVQINRNGIITHIYPLKGNESALGLNINSIPEQADAMKKAIELRQLYFQGPVQLKQGGVGIIGRYPIFKKDSLIGMASVILMRDSILDIMSLSKNGANSSFVYNIKHLEDAGETRKLFNDHSAFDKNPNQTSTRKIGNWMIQVKMVDPGYKGRMVIFLGVGFAFTIIAAYLTWILSIQPIKFRYLLAQKTRNLKTVNRQLKHHTEELEKSNSELEQFAHIASHDLKEPLRSISSFLTQLDKKYSDTLDVRGKQYIEFAVTGAKRMKTLIDDILAFSSVGKLEKNLEPVDLNSLIIRVQQMNYEQIQETNATLKVDHLPVIKSNGQLLFLIFHNLIGNAIKYRRNNTAPSIEIQATESKSEWVISVSDNGIGIDKTHHEKIFLIFQRLQSREDTEGNGIGLSIVKKAVDSLGGRIWLESEPEKGSIFYFSFPKND